MVGDHRSGGRGPHTLTDATRLPQSARIASGRRPNWLPDCSADRKAVRRMMRPYLGKRVVDLMSAGTACVVFAPLAAGIALATWFEDGGPPLFLQTRVGHQRRPFTVFKFRTMRDQQVTCVGRWLRQTGLDELPQFINVWRGEMSVVGPRPLTAGDIQRLGWAHQDQDWRFAVRPGITGLSQLLAGRSVRYSRRLERLYLRRQSLSFDLRLIALSVAVSLVGKRLVRRWLRHTITLPQGPAGRDLSPAAWSLLPYRSPRRPAWRGKHPA